MALAVNKHENLILSALQREGSVEGDRVEDEKFMKIIEEWQNSNFKYKEFGGDYSEEEIESDKNEVRQMIKKFGQTEGAGRSDETVEAEYLTAEMIYNYLGFGENSDVYMTTKYDDLKGVDLVVVLESADGKKRVYLGVDTTVDYNSMEVKTKKTLGKLDKDELYKVKYFRDEETGEVGAEMPRIVIGIDKDEVARTKKILLGDEKDKLEKDGLNKEILQEGIDQLYRTLFYVLKKYQRKFSEFGDFIEFGQSEEINYEEIDEILKYLENKKEEVKSLRRTNPESMKVLESYRDNLEILTEVEKGKKGEHVVRNVFGKKIGGRFLDITSSIKTYTDAA